MNIRNNIVLFISTLIFVACQNNVKHAEWKDNGQIVKMDYIGDTATGKFEGIVKSDYPSGEWVTYRMVNNLAEGYKEQFYKSGKIHYRSYFIHGLKEGVVKEFYENGELKVESGITHDTLNGFGVAYYPNGIMSRYDVIVKGTAIYTMVFDTTGERIKRIRWDCYIKADSTIHLGQKFHVEFILPLLKGISNISDFNIGATPPMRHKENDSTDKYDFIGRIDNSNWVYTKIYKDTLFENNTYYNFDNKVALSTIPINDKGAGVFEYTPTLPGNYIFKGCVSIIVNKADNTVHPIAFNIEFTVTK